MFSYLDLINDERPGVVETSNEKKRKIESYYDSLLKRKDDEICIIKKELEEMKSKYKEILNSKKIKDDSDLIEGEYYQLWLSDDKRFIIPVCKPNENSQNIQYKNIPVVALYNEGRLVDIVSGEYFTLNPLKEYLYRNYYSYYVVDHATILKKEALLNACRKIYNLSELELENYKKEMKYLVETLLKNKEKTADEIRIEKLKAEEIEKELLEKKKRYWERVKRVRPFNESRSFPF